MKLEFDHKSFSKKIRQKRLIDLDIDMRTASKKIGTSPSTISRVENGKLPDVLTYARLCKWLGIPMEEFIIKK